MAYYPQSNNENTGPPRKRRRLIEPPSMISYANEDIDDPNYQFICMITNGAEGNIAVRANAPNPIPNELPRERFDSMATLLENPGIYTWILFEDRSFAASRILSPGEILSKHKNMHRNAQAGNVHRNVIAAGECRIDEGRRVSYNLLSGSYMLPLFKRFEKRFPDTTAEIYYKQQITPLWRAAGAATVDYHPVTFVPTRLTPEMREQYEGLGYVFHEFPTLEECKASVGGSIRDTRTRIRKRGMRRHKTRRHVRRG